MSDWNQLLRYVRGDASAKLTKDKFCALIESTDARIRELEEGLDKSAQWASQLYDENVRMRDQIAAHEKVCAGEVDAAPRAKGEE